MSALEAPAAEPETEKKPPSLSAVEQSVYGLFEAYTDVSITRIYETIIKPAAGDLAPRQQQQAVGKYISRVNAKLAAMGRDVTIKPGAARRTYRLRRTRAS